MYRAKDCMKKFCEFVREQAMKIISFFFKKKMKLLTKEHQESYDNAKSNLVNNISEKIHRIKCKL